MFWRKAARGFLGGIRFVTLPALCIALAVFAAFPHTACGTAVFESDQLSIDASHADQGYVLVRHDQTDKALKLRVSKEEASLNYNLEANGEYAAFPFTLGDGQYTIAVYQNISGTWYVCEASYDIDVILEDESLPFLYPNQYVWYTPDSKAVAKAAQLCEGLDSDFEKLSEVRAYVTGHIAYDYALAQTVANGYLPSVDDVLETGRGICLDYAALTACMLRSQGVPTQLVIGYAGQSYHAWNNVLVDGEWLRVDTTAEANNIVLTDYTVERIH